MEGMITNARQFLESEEGQKFEKQIQDQFMGNKGDASSNQGPGNAGQEQDSTSGMNSAPSDRLNDNSSAADQASGRDNAYDQAGQQNTYDSSSGYNANDTTSEGGYGTNAGGDSFSSANQTGMGGNSAGQFGGTGSANDPQESYIDQEQSSRGPGDDQGY